MKETYVLKIGGNELNDQKFLERLAKVVGDLSSRVNLVIVHGGGKEIADLHHRLGVEYEFVEGLRATGEEGIKLVEMVLSGLVNKRLVRLLVSRGIDAMGMSGVDRGLMVVEPRFVKGKSLGFVGQIVRVKAEAIREELERGVIPVISPVSLGRDGNSYNVNADEAAQAVAIALPADALIFLTNVPGVLVDGEIVGELSPDEAERLVEAGIVYGGMIPKVRSAASAVRAGVKSVVITNLEGLSIGHWTAVIGSSNVKTEETR
jgi:acetylglutamate kinase